MIYCFLADGFEETEALAPIDILRRSGIDVKTVGVTGDVVSGSHKIPVKSDMNISELTFDDMDGVILPGGMPGVKNLDACEKVREAALYCVENNLPVCAICAAPSILGRLGALSGIKATCFPSFEPELKGAVVSADKVVTDKNFITAKGAGAALEFGFAIVSYLKGEKKADEIASAMQYKEV